MSTSSRWKDATKSLQPDATNTRVTGGELSSCEEPDWNADISDNDSGAAGTTVGTAVNVLIDISSSMRTGSMQGRTTTASSRTNAMRSYSVLALALVMAACASAPPGPDAGEVQTQLDGEVAAIARAIAGGQFSQVVARFAPDARLIVTGVQGPDGQPLNVDVSGHQPILGFLSSVGAPPGFEMNVTSFQLDGDVARQSGGWSAGGGEVSGAFTVEWLGAEEGWLVRLWQFEG